MRIALCIGELSVGGAETQMAALATGMAARGHRVRIFTLFPGGQKASDLNAVAGVEVTPLSSRKSQFFAHRMVQIVLAPWRLRRRLQRFRPDVVYSMLHLSNLVAWAATRGKLSRALIWGYRASNMKLNIKRYVPERLCKWASSSVPLIIANSEAGSDYIRAVRKFSPKRLEIVYNGIDTDRFQPRPDGARQLRKYLGIPEAASVVGMVARMDPMKGHEVFLCAANRLTAVYANCYFLMVGEGPEKVVERLKQRATELALSKRVIWFGSCHDVAVVYSCLDVLCSSSYGEGFSNVIAEAMACGTPCVATDVGDSARIVGHLGLVVPPNDYVSLSEALLSILTGRWRSEPTALRESIEQRFSLQKYYERTESIFAEFCCDS